MVDFYFPFDRDNCCRVQRVLPERVFSIHFYQMSSVIVSFLRVGTCGRYKTFQIRTVNAQNSATLESGIDVGQGITVGPGKLIKKNKRRALNKHRA